MRRFLESLSLRPAATDAAIVQFERQSGRKLPADYVEFLMVANGGEGSIGKSYAQLWRVEELLELNEAYEVEQNAPGLLFFGADGGGEAFAFDTRRSPWTVVVVPFIGNPATDARLAGDSFNEFVELLYEQGLSAIL